MAFAPGCFCGLPFGGVSLGRNFVEFQKMRDEGVLAKFAIAWLFAHFGSRGLKQNVVLCLHFKCILIRRWWHLRKGVFVAYILEEFPFLATLRNFKTISFKCQPSTTFCCKPRLLKCPWSRAMSSLPRGPPARVF